MIGRVFCLVWAHHWAYMFTNDHARAVLHCTRCAKIWVDK
jgi:hypothetical protein